MTNKKRIMSLGLAGILLSLTACAGQNAAVDTKTEAAATGAAKAEMAATEAAASDELSWLNTSGDTYPVVKDGVEKTLRIYVQQDPKHAKPEDSWAYRYLTDHTGVNLEFTSFYPENRDEFLALAFASDELPDIILDGAFTTDELMRYGAVNGQLLDLSPYINETYMPNLSGIYEEYPEFKNSVQDSEGRVWSLGYIANPKERGYIERVFTNYDWLEQCGLEIPSTLDEFVDAMRTFKEKGLADYPVGGSYTCENPSGYILNALGYLRVDGDAGNICLRNGNVVLPYADREAFGEYLKVMNTMYEEQLIHPDFYTMDSTTSKAVLSEGAGFIADSPYTYVPNNYKEYWAALPLTSHVNDTAQWTGDARVPSFGSVVVTSACEEPELAAKFLDCFYDMEEATYRYMWAGLYSFLTPDDETADAYADVLYGEEMVKDGSKWYFKGMKDNPDAYANTTEYLYKHINIWRSVKLGAEPWGFIPGNPYMYYGEKDWNSYTDRDQLRADAESYNDGGKHFRIAMQAEMTPYLTEDVYPNAVYLDESLAVEMGNIKTGMDEYAQQEIARFVTGARELNDAELNNYFDTLEQLGAKEYVQVYADYYENMK